MPVEIEQKEPSEPFCLVQATYLVPIRIAEIRSLICSENHSREEAVKKNVFVGDVCVSIKDEQMYTCRLFHGPSGTLLPSWYGDYLLFENADDVKRIVIAKPNN